MRRHAGRTHGSHPRPRSPSPDRCYSVFPVDAGRVERISPGRISLPWSTPTQAQPLRDKLASSSFVVAVPSGGLFLDVSQSVCGGPSSSLSLAVSICLRIVALLESQ